MKYPKVLRVLAIAAAVSVAAPGGLMPAYASEAAETPQEYTARTGYVLPEGFHYVLDGEYVILDENGQPLLEADPVPEIPEEPAAPAIPETPVEPIEAETPSDKEVPEEPENPEEPDGAGNGETEESGETIDKADEAENDGEDKDETEGSEESSDKADNTEENGEKQKEETGETDDKVDDSDQGSERNKDETDESEKAGDGAEIGSEPFFLTSAQFKALHDRIQYNVEISIEGLPPFITQEMVVGALKAQDETGFPASVTIAQIIQESGYGKYGPGGEDGEGLSYLAFEYCNLFGMKGTGTAGSVSMKTSEMEDDGSLYSVYAGFRVYNTYTECIEDRSELLEEVYSDLTENVTDANTFAMKVGKRWATDLNYGKHLINTMRRYDLYRLDDMTLSDFTEMVGEFVNPCPGSTITSLFGRREAPIAGATTYHKGVDMGTGAYNIPTYAAKAGTVVFAGEAGACGNMITIDHGNGLVTKYMHHAAIFVKEGDTVEQGQQIGLSGTTGNSTGNHLHFQVEEYGTAVDPLKYLQASAEEADAAKKNYVKKQAEAADAAKEAKVQMLREIIRGKLNF